MVKSLYLALPVLFCLALGYPSFAVSKKAGDGPYAHMVFFTLKDHSKESVEAFVALCDKYLTKHDGTKYYSLGLREQIIFPEINYDKVDKVRGMTITIATTAKNNEQARAVLAELGMPFKK